MSNQSQVRLRVFLLAVCLAPVAVARAATPRVMPLGDSITESTGYRVKLKNKIETAGLQVTWVGGQTDSTGLHHEGHSGYQIQQLYGFSTKWIPAAMPDIILLQIGTNDMWRKREFDAGHLTADQLPAPLLNSLLGKLFDLQPDVAIIVSQIPPMSQYDPQPVPADQKAAVAMAVGAAVRDYVDGIPAVVQAWAKKGKRITTVDMYHALSVTDLVDGVHPNDVGYEKMASTWFPALKSLLMMQPSEVPDAGAASDTAAAGQGGQGGRGGQGGNAGAAGSAGGARGATDEGGSGPDAAGGQGGQGGEGGGDSNADDDAATKKSGCSFGGSSSHVTWLFLLLLAWPLRRRARRG